MPKSDEQKPQSKPDDLVKPGKAELSEKELKNVTGGAPDGATADSKHKAT